MYISLVKIFGYRNFKEIEIPLHEGINVLIGSNNSGKSNMLRAIALALNADGFKRINLSDIFREIDINVLKDSSPKVEITLICTQSTGESDTSEIAGLLGDCLIPPLTSPYNASINFRYSLSPDKETEYLEDVASLSDHNEIWNLLSINYERFYEIKRWGGADAKLGEIYSRIDFQFLDAIRDVSRDMCMGYNPLLKEVLNFFIDYEVKCDDSKDENQIKEELKSRQAEFRENSIPLMTNLHDRLHNGKNILLNYANSIGASFNNVIPDFNGQLSESELFSVLQLIIRHEFNVEIPATHNGLGFNNLIYMSLLLAKMQASSDGKYMGRQANLFSLLAFEEPEAHLHPAMQYQFLNFLNKNRDEHSVGQIIVTTHSTQIVSAVNIDNLICLHSCNYGVHSIGYPIKCFTATEEDQKSKALVQRYLDATRSDMFFANKLIFVEGIVEEILLPTFARYLGYDLAYNHILIINTGLRYYRDFLKMFDSQLENRINKRIACITDIDPMQDGTACYPYEYGVQEGHTYSHHADEEMSLYSSHPNIRYFRQSEQYGKTLEYEIAWCNANCKLLLTKSIKNYDELNDLMELDSSTAMLDRLRKSDENERIKNSIGLCSWTEEDKCKAIIASRYLNSIGKGGNALELSIALEENLRLPDDNPNKVEFVIPPYIAEALEWLMR
ncbi:ATP-dependent nuclease [Bacteroides acidifaciens]|uniref:ATP-dependent nuclease n=1 Tax=Bacteroides acidifaciens TaxID=85831 RepID=UPI002715296B|nr:AAA family ATPase [Bacteroides acidifaciens]